MQGNADIPQGRLRNLQRWIVGRRKHKPTIRKEEKLKKYLHVFGRVSCKEPYEKKAIVVKGSEASRER
jgi:hypothetical protein